MRSKENLQSESSMLSIPFDDGSVFNLPKEWEDVFVDYFGINPDSYPLVAERLKYVTGKYVGHRAWPSKFDGMDAQAEDRKIELSDYDNPEFYMQRWEDEEIIWGSGDQRRKITIPPTFCRSCRGSNVFFNERRAFTKILTATWVKYSGYVSRTVLKIAKPLKLIRDKQIKGGVDVNIL